MAEERPLCHVVATDFARRAENCRAEQGPGRPAQYQLPPRRLVRAAWGDRFTVIVCNPPYVPQWDYEAALAYEPIDALFSGARGLDALRTVVREAPTCFEPGG